MLANCGGRGSYSLLTRETILSDLIVPSGLDMLRDAYTSCADTDPELPVVVSLFSGIEGIGAGLALSGFQTVVAVEWDPDCQKVIRARFPEAVIYSDVREVDPDEIRQVVGGRRVIGTGGFPCQDVSVAGGRAGVDGTRSGLYVELIRIFDALDPDWLVVENVAGLLSADLDPDDLWDFDLRRGGNQHTHRYQGQTLRHSHDGGNVSHGYFEHPEDGVTVVTPAVDEAMQDLILTVVKATIALDRKEWQTVLDAAKRLEEHGMRLASLASRRSAQVPAGG